MTGSAGILPIDHNERFALLSSFLHEAGYRTHQVSDITAFDEVLGMPAAGEEIALAPVDLALRRRSRKERVLTLVRILTGNDDESL